MIVKKTLCLGAAVLFFLTGCYLVLLARSGVSQVEITASSEQAAHWQVFFSSAPWSPQFNGSRTSVARQLPAGKKTTLFFPLNNVPAASLRFDTGDMPGTVRIYRIAVRRGLAADKIFSGQEIYAAFKEGHAGVSMTPGNGFVDVVSTVADPFLVSRSPRFLLPDPGMFVVPLCILSIFFFQALCRMSFAGMKKYFLVERDLPQGSAFGSLDGLRGFAALLVIVEHTWARFLGIGFSGVVIFFVLSGFLLARPFVEHPEKIRDKGFLMHYGRRRLQRILPMYYLYIVLVYVLSLQLSNAILHFFFLKGDGHLWAVPQEMLFYLVFPLIALFTYGVFRGKVRWIVPVLVLFAFATNAFLTNTYFSLYGMDNQLLPFYLGVFLTGCCASYVYFGWYVHSDQKKSRVTGGYRRLVLLVGCAVLVLFIGFSNGYLLNSAVLYSHNHYGWFGLAAAVLVLVLLYDPTSLLNRLFSQPLLRSVGVVSYSFYLLHPLVLGVLLGIGRYCFSRQWEGGWLFVLTSLISYPVAVITYRVVELPFMQSKNKK